MTMCHCDGPPHPYDPSWCGVGRGDNGKPIGQQVIIIVNPGGH
jgi:hypothetical protein